MGSLNSVTLLGRATAAPELRSTNGGKSVANFSLAVDKRGAKEGEKSADFFTIILWDKTAEFAAQFLTKGREVVVQGRLQNREYDNKDNVTVRVTEIVASELQLCGPKPQGDSSEEAAPAARTATRAASNGGTTTRQPAGKTAVADPGDDFGIEDIPFEINLNLSR